MISMVPSRPDTPGVVAPPPLVYLGFLLLGNAIDYLFGGIADFGDWRVPAGAVLCIAALVFLILAAGLFRKAGTHAEPWQPTTALVTTGIYGVSRNPMYVGMALAYVGLALITSSLAAMLLFPVALLVMHRGVILREEAYLTKKFGAEYLSYKARIRRWL